MAATDALDVAGWAPPSGALPLWHLRLWHFNTARLHRGKILIPVDIHWSLHAEALGVDLDADSFRSRSVPVDILGARASVAHPVDQWIHLATHFASHLGARFGDPDILRLLAESANPPARLRWIGDLVDAWEAVRTSGISEALARIRNSNAELPCADALAVLLPLLDPDGYAGAAAIAAALPEPRADIAAIERRGRQSHAVDTTFGIRPLHVAPLVVVGHGRGATTFPDGPSGALVSGRDAHRRRRRDVAACVGDAGAEGCDRSRRGDRGGLFRSVGGTRGIPPSRTRRQPARERRGPKRGRLHETRPADPPLSDPVRRRVESPQRLDHLRRLRLPEAGGRGAIEGPLPSPHRTDVRRGLRDRKPVRDRRRRRGDSRGLPRVGRRGSSFMALVHVARNSRCHGDRPAFAVVWSGITAWASLSIETYAFQLLASVAALVAASRTAARPTRTNIVLLGVAGVAATGFHIASAALWPGLAWWAFREAPASARRFGVLVGTISIAALAVVLLSPTAEFVPLGGGGGGTTPLRWIAATFAMPSTAEADGVLGRSGLLYALGLLTLPTLSGLFGMLRPDTRRLVAVFAIPGWLAWIVTGKSWIALAVPITPVLLFPAARALDARPTPPPRRGDRLSLWVRPRRRSRPQRSRLSGAAFQPRSASQHRDDDRRAPPRRRCGDRRQFRGTSSPFLPPAAPMRSPSGWFGDARRVTPRLPPSARPSTRSTPKGATSGSPRTPSII
jgi:hypothetical protein